MSRLSTPMQQALLCLDNCKLAFAHYALPSLDDHFTCIALAPDRCFFDFQDGATYGAFLTHMEGTGAWGTPPPAASLVGSNAFERWNLNSNHGPTAVAGWRERRALHAMQIVLHRMSDSMRLEVDFDRFNPAMGLAPALLHSLLEVLPNWLFRRLTQPEAVRRSLVARGICKDYNLEENHDN